MEYVKFTHENLIPALKIFENGAAKWQNSAVMPFTNGYLEEDGPYAVKLSLKGKLALKGVFEGSLCKVTDSHRVALIRGKTGTIERILLDQIDADGVDEWDLPVQRAKKSFTVIVRFPDIPGQWCIYNLDDIIGYPKWKVSIV